VKQQIGVRVEPEFQALVDKGWTRKIVRQVLEAEEFLKLRN